MSIEAPATPGPARPRNPTKRLGAIERREQLVATAKRLFAERGYRATTMEDIASAAGVTKPLLYQHFESKRALYLELVHQISDALVQSLHSAYRQAAGPREKVENGYRVYFELIVTHQDAFRLLFGRHAPEDPELSLATRRVEAAVLDLVEETMSNDLQPDHRRLLAHAVVGMAEGGARFWVESTRNRTPPEEAMELMIERVSRVAWVGLRGITPA